MDEINKNDDSQPSLMFTKNRPSESLKKMAKNEIYISNKRNQIEKFYYKRAHQLIYTLNYKEIFISGLGSCVNLAVKVALFIIDAIPSLSIDKIETDTITHVDDYRKEENGELIMRKQDRRSNIIRIKLIKK